MIDMTGDECKKQPNWRLHFDFTVTADPAPVACACFLEAYVQAAIYAGCRHVSFHALLIDPLNSLKSFPAWAAEGEGAESGAQWVWDSPNH